MPSRSQIDPIPAEAIRAQELGACVTKIAVWLFCSCELAAVSVIADMFMFVRTGRRARLIDAPAVSAPTA